jgi:hypothetical protein
MKPDPFSSESVWFLKAVSAHLLLIQHTVVVYLFCIWLDHLAFEIANHRLPELLLHLANVHHLDHAGAQLHLMLLLLLLWWLWQLLLLQNLHHFHQAGCLHLSSSISKDICLSTAQKLLNLQ